MKSIIALLVSCKSTLAYIALIVVLNTLFVFVPLVTIMGLEVSPMDIAVGLIYVFRDFAQREMGHKVIFAMLIGGVLSYVLADKAIAIASMSSFVIAEAIDWGIYTYTKRPLSKRILWSASISSPIDSVVFLYLVHQLNWLGFVILTAAKILGVVVLWYIWNRREQRSLSAINIPPEQVASSG